MNPALVEAGPAIAAAPTDRAAFLLRLRARGIRDLALLRALEAVPRAHFVPHRYADLALKDIALPLAGGQTMTEPSVVARMLQELEVEAGCRVFEVGSGSGYATALMARLGAEVVGVERLGTLAQGASSRLSSLGLVGVEVIRGDGLAPPRDRGSFDRVLVNGRMADAPDRLAAIVRPGGTIVFARPPRHGEPDLVRARPGQDGAWDVQAFATSRLAPLLPGVSLEL